jgi:hypothetical protein
MTFYGSIDLPQKRMVSVLFIIRNYLIITSFSLDAQLVGFSYESN